MDDFFAAITDASPHLLSNMDRIDPTFRKKICQISQNDLDSLMDGIRHRAPLWKESRGAYYESIQGRQLEIRKGEICPMTLKSIDDCGGEMDHKTVYFIPDWANGKSFTAKKIALSRYFSNSKNPFANKFFDENVLDDFANPFLHFLYDLLLEEKIERIT